MALVDDLRAARALIDTPEKWGKGNGHMLGNVPLHKECAVTACYHVCGSVGSRYARAVEALERQIPATVKPWLRALHRYNDATTHADVMSVFYRALAKAEAR